MFKFLIRLSCFCLVQLVIALVVMRNGNSHSDDYLAAIYDKCRLLDDQRDPRLIFVGGSNTAFGIDSPTFKRELPYQPVNLGLNGALGLEYCLRMVEKSVRFGDVIIIIPEYPLLTGTFDGTPSYHANVLARHWPVGELPEGARYFVKFNAAGKAFCDREAFGFGALWVREHLKIGGQSPPQAVYCRAGFNEYGDMVAHHGRPSSSTIGKLNAFNQFSEEALDAAIRRLNEFHDFCQARGARVFFAYCPYPQGLFRQSQEHIRRIENRVATTLQIPVLTSPDEVAFPDDHFFDNEYHLNQTGTAKRCALLLDRLSRQLPEVAARPAPRRN